MSYFPSFRVFQSTSLLLLFCLANPSPLLARDAVSGAERERPRIGLVLSGGGAKGAAHVGVIQVLERLGIQIDVVVGTSMGAIFGGLYASGLSGEELERAVREIDWIDIFNGSSGISVGKFRGRMGRKAVPVLGLRHFRGAENLTCCFHGYLSEAKASAGRVPIYRLSSARTARRGLR